MKKSNRFKKLALLIIVGAALLLSLCVLVLVRLHNSSVVVRHIVTHSVPDLPVGLDGLKIALLSDFHLRQYLVDKGTLENMFRILEKEKPDLIALPGDFMNQNAIVGNFTYPEITAFLRRFHAPLGVYASLGNHDRRYVEKGLRAAFAASGVILLENTMLRVRWRGTELEIAGIGDYYSGQSNIVAALQGACPGVYTILLSHNPLLFLHGENTAELMLSGHTHGGQVRLPYIGAPAYWVLTNMRFDRGFYLQNGRALALTSGVGTSNLNIRVGIPPEVMLITLRRQFPAGVDGSGSQKVRR